jgi:hypothetical protein
LWHVIECLESFGRFSALIATDNRLFAGRLQSVSQAPVRVKSSLVYKSALCRSVGF